MARTDLYDQRVLLNSSIGFRGLAAEWQEEAREEETTTRLAPVDFGNLKLLRSRIADLKAS